MNKMSTTITIEDRTNNSKRKLIKTANSYSDEITLFVEGYTDEKFFSNFTKDTTKVFKAEDFVETSEQKNVGKQGVIHAIKITSHKKNSYGIVDKDYDFSYKDIPKGLRNIFVTDANSLETFIIQFSSKEIANKINSIFKIYDFNVIEDSLEISKKIGQIRFYNYSNNINFNFKKTLKDYTDYLIKKENKFDLDEEKFICRITESKCSIKNTVYSQLRTISKNQWELSQGHDVENFLSGIIYKIQIETKHFYSDLSEIEKKVKKIIHETFSEKEIYKSKLFKNLLDHKLIKPLAEQ